jgi:hypothetical protein
MVKQAVHRERLNYVVLALILSTAKITHAMNASPQNLEVEQCVDRSNDSEQAQYGLRGVGRSEDCFCREKMTLVLKQNGNEMIHWMTTDDGTSAKSNKLFRHRLSLSVRSSHSSDRPYRLHRAARGLWRLVLCRHG